MQLIKHECGNPLWMESVWCGECFAVNFFDARKDSPHRKVQRCPTCDDALGQPLNPLTAAITTTTR